MSHDPSPTSTPEGAPVTPRLLGLVALVIAPVVVLSASPWAAGGSLFFLGMLPAGVGVLISVRVALVGGLMTAALMMAAVPFRDEPVAGSLLMTAIGVVVGLSSTQGWHGVGSFAGPQTAFALIGSPTVALASTTVGADSSAAATVAMGAWVAAGGLWIALLGGLAGSALPSREPPAVSAVAGQYFAVALGLLAGIGAYVAMEWTTAPGAWWLLLTLFVVMQPSYAATVQRTTHRVLGTVLGAVLAALVAGVLDGFPVLVSLVALGTTVAAVWAFTTQPYWVYTTFLTPAVILQTSGGASPILWADLQRVAFTVGAAVVAVGVLTVGHRILQRR